MLADPAVNFGVLVTEHVSRYTTIGVHSTTWGNNVFRVHMWSYIVTGRAMALLSALLAARYASCGGL